MKRRWGSQRDTKTFVVSKKTLKHFDLENFRSRSELICNVNPSQHPHANLVNNGIARSIIDCAARPLTNRATRYKERHINDQQCKKEMELDCGQLLG